VAVAHQHERNEPPLCCNERRYAYNKVPRNISHATLK
jgi:hypothetical protein